MPADSGQLKPMVEVAMGGGEWNFAGPSESSRESNIINTGHYIIEQ